MFVNLKVNLQITGLNNKIILIGDDQLENLSRMDNVTFVNINKYENLPLLKESYANFTNFSSNNKTFEWICFERVFILKFFMKEFKLNHVFHIDSDNILFDNINNYPCEKAIAYCINTNWRQYRMSNSIHCGLLNEEFCEKFIGLFNDIYVNIPAQIGPNMNAITHTDVLLNGASLSTIVLFTSSRGNFDSSLRCIFTGYW